MRTEVDCIQQVATCWTTRVAEFVDQKNAEMCVTGLTVSLRQKNAYMVCDPAINNAGLSKNELRFLSCWVNIFNK